MTEQPWGDPEYPDVKKDIAENFVREPEEHVLGKRLGTVFPATPPPATPPNLPAKRTHIKGR